ncbi:hypothetical protein [Hymenobacter persicinus]|uniref:Virulence factor n=1 Tax=Hymenobacter persicinus TaxID=2025506 RepID=A0A4Q5LDC8_9BACT|nr:hypothetical protein [Hymenobacter persicinus]RYU81574.1 hypothetical protein EWM57_06145 [Hymenobacter persicinus]
MKNLLKLPALLGLLLLLGSGLTSCVASTQAVAVRPYPPRRAYYYPPRPVVVVPAPVVVRPRPMMVVPARPYYYQRYNARPHRYVRVR